MDKRRAPDDCSALPSGYVEQLREAFEDASKAAGRATPRISAIFTKLCLEEQDRGEGPAGKVDCRSHTDQP